MNVVNKINCSENEIIKKMLCSFYETNDKFKLLMSEFKNIVITKSFHKDYYDKNLHFTGYLQNTINNIKTSQLHFY